MLISILSEKRNIVETVYKNPDLCHTLQCVYVCVAVKLYDSLL